MSFAFISDLLFWPIAFHFFNIFFTLMLSALSHLFSNKTNFFRCSPNVLGLFTNWYLKTRRLLSTLPLLFLLFLSLFKIEHKCHPLCDAFSISLRQSQSFLHDCSQSILLFLGHCTIVQHLVLFDQAISSLRTKTVSYSFHTKHIALHIVGTLYTYTD